MQVILKSYNYVYVENIRVSKSSRSSASAFVVILF